MTDIEFLNTLEFRANIRKQDHHVIGLSEEDSKRFNILQGWGGYAVARSYTRDALLRAIEFARSRIVAEVTAKLR